MHPSACFAFAANGPLCVGSFRDREDLDFTNVASAKPTVEVKLVPDADASVFYPVK